MKKFVLLIVSLLLLQGSFGQLTGTFTIPGTPYATIAAAVTDLNTQGVGSGGVTFLISTGYTEAVTAPILITTAGSAANPIVFKSSGTGAKPVINRTDAGTVTTSSFGGQGDGVVIIQGTDNITFDSVDITAGNQGIEYGYFLRKASGTDGCKTVNIKNAAITMTKGTSAYAIGIYSSNLDAASLPSAQTGVTVTSTEGRHENVTINGNTISNVFSGILLRGYADATPYTFYDQNFTVGASGSGNIIQNYGGNATAISYGIRSIYVTSVDVSHNTINNALGGSNATGGLYGICLDGSYAGGDLKANHNGITLGQGAASNAIAMYIYALSTSINANYNTFAFGTFVGSTCYLIYANTSTNDVTITNNQTSGTINKTGASGSFYCYYNLGSPTGGTETLSDNNFSNITVGGTSAFYGIYSNTSTSQNRIATGNTVSNITTNTGTAYPLYLLSSLSNQIHNNFVNNITGSGTMYGLYFTGTNPTVYENVVSNLTTSAATLYGIYNGGTGTTNCYKNQVYSLTSNSASAALYGMYITTGTSNNVYNNYVSALYTPSASATHPLAGMYVSGGTAVNLYYNTIFLNATTSGTNFGTSGIFASTTPTLELRNNNVVNISTAKGTGFTAAFRRSSTTLTTYAASSNNNNFFVGIPSATQLIYIEGTSTTTYNPQQTIAGYKSYVSPRDGTSFTEDPPFVNKTTIPYDLRIQTTIATQCESAGTNVTTPVVITDDFEGTIRQGNAGYLGAGTAPDVGADEFEGILLDITAPGIVFTPFLNTASTTARTLITTISDPSGVPTAGIGLPRLFWKKFASGSWEPAVTGTYVSGSTYSFTFGGGVVLNDSIYYYIVAQDGYSTPNVGSSPPNGSGYTANPPAAGTPPPNGSLYAYQIIGTICGTFNVGVGQTYTTLTAAINDLNNKEIICPVTFLLTDANYSTAELFPLIIFPNGGSSPTNTVTIKPAPGITPTITASSTSGIIVLYGCSYVILDGSNSGGTDRSLTWENSNGGTTTPYVIGIFNMNGTGTNNCVIKNNQVKASSQVTNNTYGIIFNAAGGGYANVLVNNNAISSARYGMQVAGVSGNVANNIQVTNNTIGSVTAGAGITYRGVVVSNTDNLVFSGNDVFGDPAGNANYSQAGLYIIAGTTNSKFLGNKVHDFYYTGTSGWGQYGIYYGAEATSVNEFSNNLIYNIKGDGYSLSISTFNIYGMFIYSGGNLKIHHNTIDLAGNYLSSSYASWSGALCIYSSGSTLLDIRDNILKNSLQPVSGAPASKTFAIINAATAAAFTSINFNDYFADGIGPNIGYQGSDLTTLANWQAASLQDGNSLNLNPSFVSSTDLHPTNAGLSNTGTYIATVPTDFDGVLRTNPPDVGAYEFGNDPVVTTTAASSITNGSATMNGTIMAAGLTVNSFFDYGLTAAYGSSVPGIPASVSGTTVTPISRNVSMLTGNTVYHYRARGVVGGLTIYGPDMTFTTLPDPPIAITNAASAVTTTTATMNGSINAKGSPTTVTFEYGLTAAYGTTISATPGTVNGTSFTAVTGPITGLITNTVYHYRVVGVNAGGTTYGLDTNFTTLPSAPAVLTNAASNIGTTSAQLNGTVAANNANTTVTFEWGLTAAYGNIAAATPGTVTGFSPTPVLANISGLTTNTTYHFRCKGVNAGGTVYGLDQTFLSGCPPVGAAGTITGPASVCASSTGNVYSIAAIVNATGYTWTVPAGATITGGQNTTSITVTYGTTSGNVSVYGTGPCGNGTPNALPVTVNPLPVPTITGPATACQGSTTNVYSTQAGMTGYAWAVSAGGSITAGSGTNTVTVTWNTPGAQTISVGYSSPAGCASAAAGVYNVTVNAAPVPTITGPTSMCVNSGYYNYSTEGNFSNYVWTTSPGGLITFGQGTSQVQVIWNLAGAQWVAVNYTNASGCAATAPVQLAVTVDPAPNAAGAITGTSAVCAGANGVAYSCSPITNATSYVWTLPSGASIASGAGTNAITVNFAANATSGDITVVGNNLCGNGTASPPFPVTVSGLPADAGVITGLTAVCQGETGVVYTVPAIANATGYVWTVPAGATIASGSTTASITVDFGMSAVSGNVTVYGTNSCGNGVASSLAVAVNTIPPAPVITLNLDILSSNAYSGNQWYFEGAVIPGATSQTWQAVQSGWYWDVVTLNGCVSDTSNNIYVLIIGVNELAQGNVNVYPVPNDGRFTVALSSPTLQNFRVSVYNSIGVLIYDIPALEVKGSILKAIDLQSAPSGVYTLVIQNNDNHMVRKIVVNK